MYPLNVRAVMQIEKTSISMGWHGNGEGRAWEVCLLCPIRSFSALARRFKASWHSPFSCSILSSEAEHSFLLCCSSTSTRSLSSCNPMSSILFYLLIFFQVCFTVIMAVRYSSCSNYSLRQIQQVAGGRVTTPAWSPCEQHGTCIGNCKNKST